MKQGQFVHQAMQEKRPLTVGAIADRAALAMTDHACDVIELRLDSLGADEEVIEFAKNSDLPLLVTARGPVEGGQSNWSFAERQAAYEALMPYTAAIDIELRDLDELSEVVTLAKQSQVIVVGSFHDFEKTPSPEKLRGKLGEAVDIHKFALRVNQRGDLTTLLELLDNDLPLSVMGMGPQGAAARPLMAKAGSLLNYGYLGATPTAPDQWPAGLLRETLAL